jgi:hypothetical protein
MVFFFKLINQKGGLLLLVCSPSEDSEVHEPENIYYMVAPLYGEKGNSVWGLFEGYSPKLNKIK